MLYALCLLKYTDYSPVFRGWTLDFYSHFRLKMSWLHSSLAFSVRNYIVPDRKRQFSAFSAYPMLPGQSRPTRVKGEAGAKRAIDSVIFLFCAFLALFSCSLGIALPPFGGKPAI